MTIAVSDFGATLVKILVPDKNGKLRDVALGYDHVEGYYDNSCHFGAVIGRNGNRVGGARFTLNGKEYQLAVNDNKNNPYEKHRDFILFNYHLQVFSISESM